MSQCLNLPTGIESMPDMWRLFINMASRGKIVVLALFIKFTQLTVSVSYKCIFFYYNKKNPLKMRERKSLRRKCLVFVM